MEQRIRRRDWRQRFAGFRVNCESIPRLPARLVDLAVRDPRGIPYLFLWQWMSDPGVKEAVRVFWQRTDEWIEVKRSDGSGERIRMSRVPLPRRGGTALLLFCPDCGIPRRHLYAWSVWNNELMRSIWKCRICAGLRYRSEGTYIPAMWRCLGGYPRTEPWDPTVFSSPKQAAAFLRSLDR